MGYFGLEHWGDSDEAADFVSVYQTAKSPKSKQNVIDKELKNFANDYNTPGSVNIALAIEDGILQTSDLNVVQLNKLRKLLKKLIDECSEKRKDLWHSEKARIEHNDAYIRLLKVVES